MSESLTFGSRVWPLDLVKYAFDALMNLDVRMVVLGSGEWTFENFFREAQNRYPARFRYCSGCVPDLARKIYAASDMFLMPSQSEPCGLSQMVACRYGALPIVRETGGLRDSISDCGDGEGNGFTFKTYNADDMLYAIRRARELYRDREAWEAVEARAMACDFSWGRSANEYMRLYRSLLKG